MSDIDDTKELPRIYVQKPVMVFKKFMSKRERKSHICVIYTYFGLLFTMLIMRFGFHFNQRPEYPDSNKCHDDPWASCTYSTNINIFIDVLSFLICVVFFIYACFLRKKLKKISAITMIVTVLYIISIEPIAMFFVDLFVDVLLIVGAALFANH
ncbi:MAG: hypothetical protein LBI63_00485 [Candidatus Ancillula sp.]|nr:hypothetical protein [Candidatus Ancillula sp.]